MKFDPFTWDEIQVATQIPFKDQIRVQLSAPGALYVSCDGYEVCAGYGASFDLVLATPGLFAVEGPKGLRAFWQPPANNSFESTGVIFTNADRLPHQGGNMAEVAKLIRQQQLEHRQIIGRMRAELAELKSVRAATEALRAPQELDEVPPKAQGADEYIPAEPAPDA